MRNEDLRRKLLAMAAHDEKVRAELIDAGELFGGYHPRMADVHDRNAAALDVIIESLGWPGISLVGKAGGDAAWLIVQHAIAQPAFQRKCLPVLKRA
ncbi:MAG: DUF6624 domain-containing protein, partial [Pseudomonadota bacterium]